MTLFSYKNCVSHVKSRASSKAAYESAHRRRGIILRKECIVGTFHEFEGYFPGEMREFAGLAGVSGVGLPHLEAGMITFHAVEWSSPNAETETKRIFTD
jgi:hypothetical protein